jgi:hypothetical protein
MQEQTQQVGIAVATTLFFLCIQLHKNVSFKCYICLCVLLLTYFPLSLFDPRAIHVGCGADEMAVGQVYL